jgi:hypothetical protein
MAIALIIVLPLLALSALAGWVGYELAHAEHLEADDPRGWSDHEIARMAEHGRQA